MKELEAQITKSSANERLWSSLQVKLVQAKVKVTECKDREQDTQDALAKSQRAVKKLMRSRVVLTKRIDAMIIMSAKKDAQFKKKLKTRDEKVRELKLTRPLVLDRIKNASETIPDVM